MRFDCKHLGRLAALLMLALATASTAESAGGEPGPPAESWPAWLPHYDCTLDLDLAKHLARVQLRATWINPQPIATPQLVFNAHSRYVVPKADVGFTAKTLELLRIDPGDALGVTEPACEIHRAALVEQTPDGGSALWPLEIRYEGDTKTSLVLALPRPVRPGEAVTVVLDLTMHLPAKQGRWGQWQGVTTLSNWLPVFAYYGPPRDRHQPVPPGPAAPPLAPICSWQPTPFIPWHQPFFNEAGHYRVRATLPADQQVACTGSIVASRQLPDGRQQLDIVAPGVRDFAFLCSARYRVFEDVVPLPPRTSPAPPNQDGGAGQGEDTLPAPRPLTPNPSPPQGRGEQDGLPSPPLRGRGVGGEGVRIRVLAFPEHEHYGREILRIASEAIAAYSKWFGPYPWPVFTIAESFFGWNGNECATLVMIDERIFNLPHLACGFVDSLVSHEVCHQWWYNLVGTNGYCETWMDEGLATYFGHRLLNEKVGKNNTLMTYPRGLSWVPNIHREDYRSYGMYGTLGRGENTAVISPMTGFGHVMNLFSMCYDKGSRIVGMIEDRLGAAAFLDFMRRVQCRYRYRILRVVDFQHELEAYTGHSWEEFFAHWLYGPGLSDWSVEKVRVHSNIGQQGERRGLAPPSEDRRDKPGGSPSAVRVEVLLHQKAEINEATVLGIAVPGHDGYPIRIPIVPQAVPYELQDPPARVEAVSEDRVSVAVCLPVEPTQITVDPDQVLVDRDPTNNFWKPPISWHLTPLYTFLDETDLTTSYDRWNVIIGPWIYGTVYYDPWYTRTTGTMIGFRAGLYHMQTFTGGVYTGYRTDYRDVAAGVDGLWDHWPDGHYQVGFNVEQRLAEFYKGDAFARRAVLFGRYIFKYGSSLYLPNMEFLDAFATYQDNFLPFDETVPPNGIRFDHLVTGGLHYRKDYLTPYWNPVGGFRWDVWYQGGVALAPYTAGVNMISSQFSMVKSLPDLSAPLQGVPGLYDAAKWLSETRLAVRAYGGTSMPGRGEFFTMGGSMFFRGFSLAERQGSTVWVGSVEWRLPVARNLHLDFCDRIIGLRNVDLALFNDVGDTYTDGHGVGPVADAVGASLRFDVAWFSLVERTLLRFDIAQPVNVNSGTQFWFGVGVPF